MRINSSNSHSELTSSQRQTGRAQTRAFHSQNLLKTGRRVTCAKDDASAMAIASKFSSRIIALEEGIRNLQEAHAALEIARVSTEKIEMLSNDIEKLQVRKGSDLKSDDQKTLVDDEIFKLREVVQFLFGNTDFNGKQMIDGTIDGEIVNFGAGDFQIQLGDVRVMGDLVAAQADDDLVAQARTQVNTALDQTLQNAIDGRVAAMQVAVNSIDFTQVHMTDGICRINFNAGSTAMLQGAVNNVIQHQGAGEIILRIQEGVADWHSINGSLTTMFENNAACTTAVHAAIDGATLTDGAALMTTANYNAAIAGGDLNHQQVMDYAEAFAVTIGKVSACVIADLQLGATAALIKNVAMQAIANEYDGLALVNAFAAHGNFAAPAAPAGNRTPEQRIYAMCKEKYDSVQATPDANTLISAYNAGKNSGVIVGDEAVRQVAVQRDIKNGIAAMQMQLGFIEANLQDNIDKLKEARCIIEDIDVLEAQVKATTDQAELGHALRAFVLSLKSMSKMKNANRKIISLMIKHGRHGR